VHITLDKSKVIHEQVIEKIVGIAEAAAAKADKSALASASRNGRAAPAPHEVEPVYVRPLVAKYVVPADARIELWDSAISVMAVEGDTVAAIASRNGVPAWAVAQINNLQADAALPAGKTVLVPHNMYRARPVGARAEAASGISQASSRRR
jgi:LysM repeat protein